MATQQESAQGAASGLSELDDFAALLDRAGLSFEGWLAVPGWFRAVRRA